MEQIDRYHIKQMLGQGGMGDVYLAHDPKLDRHVAVKVLSSIARAKPSILARFEREARALTKLEHPGIVPLYDFGGMKPDEDALPYLVMQYMPKGSLADRLRFDGKMPTDEVVTYMNQVGLALEYAHNKGFVHRDIKPGNVLLDESDSAYLADFGISKAVTDDGTDLTATNSVLGTYKYMSPEQLTRPKEVDGRTDIYALGVVLFELLTGTAPFIGDTQAQIIMAHLQQEIPSITEMDATLPRGFEDVIRRALAKDPDERYETVKAFVEELRQAKEDRNFYSAYTPVKQPDVDEAAVDPDAPTPQVLPRLKPNEPVADAEPAPEAAAEADLPPKRPFNKWWLALIGILFMGGLSAIVMSQRPTATSTTEAPAIIADSTDTPAVEVTAPPTVAAGTIRIDGNLDTAVWRQDDGGLDSLPENGVLPIQMDSQLFIQANAHPLSLNLPNRARLLLDRNSIVYLTTSDGLDAFQVDLALGRMVIEGDIDVQITVKDLLSASVQQGTMGVAMNSEQEQTEFHCFVGTCLIKIESENTISLPRGEYTAVTDAGIERPAGTANYAAFQSIYSAISGALPTPTNTPTNTPTATPRVTSTPSATPTPEREGREPFELLLGQSVDGEEITAVQMGDGDQVIIFVGGIHSGYAPNSVDVVEQAIAYFSANLEEIPDNVTAYFIPNLSPDNITDPGGLLGRLNANGVDINRNADCRWEADATVLSSNVSGSGGTEPFSEPEMMALKTLIDETEPEGVVFWTAGARVRGSVAPGACERRSEVSIPLSQYYGIAAGYEYFEDDEVQYNPALTGDVSNWLDKNGIPSIFIIMSYFESVRWENELAGIRAVLTAVSEQSETEFPAAETCPDDFSNWDSAVLVRLIRPFGCATSNVLTPSGAVQRFDAGWMVWRQDKETVYALYNDGTMVAYVVNQASVADYQVSDELKGAFGYIYNTFNSVATKLGAPNGTETVANDFRLQDFDNGVIISYSNDGGALLVINFEQDRWNGP